MNHIRRIEAILGKNSSDRPGLNLWKHFPPYDEDPKELVRKLIQFQERFDWDFVKITYQGLYSVKDWGSKIKWPERNNVWPNTCSTVAEVVAPCIQSEADWKSLEPLRIDQGAMAEAIGVAKKTVERFKGEAPVLATVFNPLTTAAKMSGDKMLFHMRAFPEHFRYGLGVITDTTIKLVRELAKAQIDGIFFATQLANFDKMTIAEYEEFGKPYDLSILDVVKDRMWFNIIHMHGDKPMFELLEAYPAQAINWHDRRVAISLVEARHKSEKILIGGIDEFEILHKGNEETIGAQLKDAIKQVGSYNFIIGPGCCVPLYVSEDRLMVAKEALNVICEGK